MGVLLDNPMTSVQLALRGGWKNLLTASGGYALVIFFGMGLWAMLDPDHLRSAAQGWTTVLLVLQTVIVVLFAIIRVTGAVRQDQTSGIMESHRLMPMTGLTACTGYIVGPTAALLAIAVVNIIAGIVATSIAGSDPFSFVMGNLVLLAFCLFGCVCGVTLGFYRRAIFSAVIVILVLGFFTGGMLFYALPGLLLLITPLAGHSGFVMTSTGDIFAPYHLAGFVGQLIVGWIVLRAAIRKFRRPDQPGFPMFAGLSLLAAAVAFSIFGTLAWDSVMPFMIRGSRDNTNRPEVQFVASMIFVVFLSLLPIAAAVRESRATTSRWPIRLLATCACAVFIDVLLCIPAVDLRVAQPLQMTAVALCVLAALTSLCAMLTLARLTPRSATVGVLGFFFVCWIVPLLIDVFYHSVMLDSTNSSVPWSITAFGPLGVFIAPWNQNIDLLPGMITQFLIALALVSFAWRVEQKRRPKQIML